MEESTLLNYLKKLNEMSPLTLDLIYAETDEEFDRALDNWFKEVIRDLEADSASLNKCSEDEISSRLAAALTTGELRATRETFTNGRVDLTIKLRNNSRVRLGEAKVWKGKKYHVKGIDQLMNRYMTGRENRGFIIAYVKDKNIKNLFSKLRDYMDKSKPYALEGACQDHTMRWSFLSKHKHSSGESVEICHLGCNLYVMPKE